MKDSYERVAYWLLPHAQHRNGLNQIIRSLAFEYDGPIFTSHLTICVGTYQSMTEVKTTLNAVSKSVCDYSLIVSGLGFENSYTKNCFIKFNQSEEISLFSKAIADRIPDGESYQCNAHLSLFYGNLSEIEKEQILLKIVLPESIKFDELVAIGIPRVNQTKSQIESWVELGRIPLTIA